MGTIRLNDQLLVKSLGALDNYKSNFYQSGASVIVKTKEEYLADISLSIRKQGEEVIILQPSGSFPIPDFINGQTGFTHEIYTFRGGNSDVHFKLAIDGDDIISLMQTLPFSGQLRSDNITYNEYSVEEALDILFSYHLTASTTTTTTLATTTTTTLATTTTTTAAPSYFIGHRYTSDAASTTPTTGYTPLTYAEDSLIEFDAGSLITLDNYNQNWFYITVPSAKVSSLTITNGINSNITSLFSSVGTYDQGGITNTILLKTDIMDTTTSPIIFKLYITS